MPTFNSRLPALQGINLSLDRSGAKPLSKVILTKQSHAQSLFGFDKSNIIDYQCKPLGYTTGFENAEIQRFYVFYKKASRDKLLKISVTPYQIISTTSAAWGYDYSLYVDINELTTWTTAADLDWASDVTGGTTYFRSTDTASDRLLVVPDGQRQPIDYTDYLDVSTWTANTIYCFEIIVKCYDVNADNELPNMIGLGHIHFSVSPEDSGKYQEETSITNTNLFVGKEIVETRADATLDSGIVQVVQEINRVKNSSFDHAQALFQDLLGPNIASYEAGSETYFIPDEIASFGTPSAIPLLTLNTPRIQKGNNGGDKVFQFCMKYVAPVTEPANHTFELEYRVRWKDTATVVQNWASLAIFSVPDNASIFAGDFNLPANPAGYPSNRSIIDFRLLTGDTANPFKIQTIAIIEKQYT